MRRDGLGLCWGHICGLAEPEGGASGWNGSPVSCRDMWILVTGVSLGPGAQSVFAEW